MKALVLCLLGLAVFPAAGYDLLIRNARVIDGSGNPWFHADVAVENGKIAAIGKLQDASAKRTVDARGMVLAPGFIDVHTHVEGGILKIPAAGNYVRDGVTTIVTGNCGGSRVDLAGFFSDLEKAGIGLNVSSLIGHNSVRRDVMGTENRQATPEEIVRMQELVEQGMRDGAVGFSTGLIYIPGTYANTEEVVSLAKAAAKYGGVYASHMRDEGDKVLEAITEAVQVGREAGVPVQLSHFKIDNKRLWGTSGKSIALVEKFRREGVDVVVDQYPYDRSSTNLGIVLPSWALAGGAEALKKRLSEPQTLARIKREMAARLHHLGHTDYSYAMVGSFPPDRSYEGKTISRINLMKGRRKTLANEIRTVLDLMQAGGAHMVYHSMGQQDVERILRYPNTAVASDGGVQEPGVGVPHPRSYGTNARVLAAFVRMRKVLTLEDAIRRMTSLPARTFGFLYRGRILEGMAADLVLFDPDTVQDKATFQEPRQFSEGFEMVLVNGIPVVDQSQPTGALPGRVLRRQ